MITISVAETSYEWRDEVFKRCGDRCAAREHDPRCPGYAQHAHHIVFKSHLTPRARYIIENGIALSLICHALAHKTHNRIVPREFLVRAVASVNVVEDVKVKPFAEAFDAV